LETERELLPAISAATAICQDAKTTFTAINSVVPQSFIQFRIVKSNALIRQLKEEKELTTGHTNQRWNLRRNRFI